MGIAAEPLVPPAPKPELRYRKQELYEINCRDFEQFVKARYGVVDFSVAADQEERNDSAITMFIADTPLAKWQADDLEKFRKAGKHQQSFMLGTLLQDLVNTGYLPAGKFLFEVSW